jgi:hypothetical protein
VILLPTELLYASAMQVRLLPCLLPHSDKAGPAAGLIARDLDLMRGGKRYIKTAAYGHFGRDDPDFTWEKVKKLDV